MFEFIRKHSKLVMILLFLLIIPSFIIVGGLDRYNVSQQQGETVATVDGHDFTKQDWDTAHQREVERARAGNPKIDPALLDSPQARYMTLESMVRDRVLAVAAQKSLLGTTDSRLQRLLLQDPSLLKADGTVDAERYKAIVAAQGMTPAAYEAQLRENIARRQVLLGVGGSAFVPPAQSNATLNAYFEQREIQFAPFKASDYASKVTPTDADIEAYYKSHESAFKASEEATIQYVLLDAAAVRGSITVDEQELKAQYAKYVEGEAAKEERRSSHILIESPAGAPAADRAKAKERATQLLAQVRAAPATFADVARKNSQDPGSAPNGGDLDFSARGGFASKALESATFDLKNKGDVSDVVESEFGYHIVKLTDIRVHKPQSFEEARPKLEEDFRNQQATKKFSEAAEAFTNTVYEQSDSLQPVVDKLKLQLRTVSGVKRTPEPGATGALGSRNFLNALFASDSLDKQRNTEAMEIGPSLFVSGRVVKYTPARSLPLAEVKDKVRAAFVGQRAAELARADGEAKLKAWQAAPAQAQVGPATVVARDIQSDTPVQVVEAALRADAAALPAFAGVNMDNDQGYLIVKINKVLPRKVPGAEQLQQERAQFVQAMSAAESLAYYDLLKQRFKVKITVPKPADTEVAAR